MSFKFNPLTGQFDIAGASGGGGSGANTSLSNLTSPTAINRDLIFDKASPVLIKTDDSAIANSSSIFITSGTTTGFDSGGVGVFSADPTGGNSGAVDLSSGSPQSADFNSGNAEVTTGAVSGIGISGQLLLSTGVVSNGTSGDISLSPGIVSGAGTRGKIKLADGSEGTPGQVWTSTGAAGEGTWAPAGSGANQTLSNLTSPTAVNQDLNIISSDAPADSIHIQARTLVSPIFQIVGGAGSSAITIDGGDTNGDNIYFGSNDTNTIYSAHVYLASGSILSNSGNVSGHVIVQSGNTSAASSGNVSIKSGDATNGGNSGDINLAVGTVTSGTQGKINMSALSLALPQQAADPSGSAGDIYYNSMTNKIRWFNGAIWADLL